MPLTLLANRAPLRKTSNGWQAGLGGLATALLPIIEQRGGAWVAMREPDSDAPLIQSYPDEESHLEIYRIPLDTQAFEDYYQGMANSVLWPLMHYLLDPMEIDHDTYAAYERVNRAFAEKALSRPHATEGSQFWVHDYHLMLVPELLRKGKPDAQIGYFWHIPWPAPEVYRILPAAVPLLKGMLGADLIGFHTKGYAENFRQAAEDLLGARIDGSHIFWEGRRICAEPHPLGIDVDFFAKKTDDIDVAIEAGILRDELNAERIVIGVDRLDYTKGLLLRFDAFERFLESHPEWHKRITFLQIATPSRTGIDAYDQLKREVDEAVGRINGRFAVDAWSPIQYRYRTYTQEELVVMYRAADVALITPLRDGMNLVAHEFAAVSRDGVLVLSELAGAAEYLDGAVPANPYDTQALPSALHQALMMSPEERRHRLNRLKTSIRALNAHDWAERFLNRLENEASVTA